MKITVWSAGETVIDPDAEYAEPMLRKAIGDGHPLIASAIIDYTDTERSDITHDQYAVVTEDDGTELWRGWLTGEKDAPPPTETLAGQARADAGRGRSESVIEAMAKAAYAARMRAVGLEPGNCEDIELHAEIAATRAVCEIDSEMARALTRPAGDAQRQVLAAIGKFEADLGFAAPETWPDRIGHLRGIVAGIFEGGADDQDDDEDEQRRADLDGDGA